VYLLREKLRFCGDAGRFVEGGVSVFPVLDSNGKNTDMSK
jgi:hypothetical protein